MLLDYLIPKTFTIALQAVVLITLFFSVTSFRSLSPLRKALTITLLGLGAYHYTPDWVYDALWPKYEQVEWEEEVGERKLVSQTAVGPARKVKTELVDTGVEVRKLVAVTQTLAREVINIKTQPASEKEANHGWFSPLRSLLSEVYERTMQLVTTSAGVAIVVAVVLWYLLYKVDGHLPKIKQKRQVQPKPRQKGTPPPLPPCQKGAPPLPLSQWLPNIWNGRIVIDPHVTPSQHYRLLTLGMSPLQGDFFVIIAQTLERMGNLFYLVRWLDHRTRGQFCGFKLREGNHTIPAIKRGITRYMELSARQTQNPPGRPLEARQRQQAKRQQEEQAKRQRQRKRHQKVQDRKFRNDLNNLIKNKLGRQRLKKRKQDAEKRRKDQLEARQQNARNAIDKAKSQGNNKLPLKELQEELKQKLKERDQQQQGKPTQQAGKGTTGPDGHEYDKTDYAFLGTAGQEAVKRGVEKTIVERTKEVLVTKTEDIMKEVTQVDSFVQKKQSIFSTLYNRFFANIKTSEIDQLAKSDKIVAAARSTMKRCPVKPRGFEFLSGDRMDFSNVPAKFQKAMSDYASANTFDMDDTTYMPTKEDYQRFLQRLMAKDEIVSSKVGLLQQQASEQATRQVVETSEKVITQEGGKVLVKTGTKETSELVKKTIEETVTSPEHLAKWVGKQVGIGVLFSYGINATATTGRLCLGRYKKEMEDKNYYECLKIFGHKLWEESPDLGENISGQLCSLGGKAAVTAALTASGVATGGLAPMLIIGGGGIASSIAGSTIYKKVKSNVYG